MYKTLVLEEKDGHIQLCQWYAYSNPLKSGFKNKPLLVLHHGAFNEYAGLFERKELNEKLEFEINFGFIHLNDWFEVQKQRYSIYKLSKLVGN